MDVFRVYSIGDDAEEIFFVDEGTIEIVWEDVRIPKDKRVYHVVTRVEDSQSLGEEGLLSDDYHPPQHVFTATAMVMSTLFYIDRAAALQLLYHHPRVKDRCRLLVTQKLNRWQAQTQNVLKEHLEQLALASGDSDAGFGKSLIEYEPKGLLPAPVFSECGQVVELTTETEPEGEQDAGESEGTAPSAVEPPGSEEDAVAALRADVRRLEAKLDKALDLLMIAPR